MTKRKLGVLLIALVTALATLTVAAPAQARGANITLNPVGARYTNTTFTLSGHIRGVGHRKNKTVLLQRWIRPVVHPGHWATARRLTHRRNGSYAFRGLKISTPGTYYYHTIVRRHGRTLDVSPRRTVVIKARPNRSPALLPDLRVQRLTQCDHDSEEVKAINHGGANCFFVEHTDPGKSDDIKLLKFAATTFNLGAGRMEVRSTRDNAKDGTKSWHDTRTVQRIFHKDGSHTDENITSKATFYWEELPTVGTDNHGHTHWHILNFDSYLVTNESGATEEKHGFCLQDGPHLAGAGKDLYPEVGSCGYREPNAVSIVHGLTPLWGDTYPSDLLDQGINISKLPSCSAVPCTITVQVHADARNILRESNEGNNTSSARVTYQGDKVLSAVSNDGYVRP